MTVSAPAEGPHEKELLDEFEEFVKGSAKALAYRAYTLCWDWYRVDDLLQETYLRMWKHWPFYRGPESHPISVAYIILRNFFIDEVRKDQRGKVRIFAAEDEVIFVAAGAAPTEPDSETLEVKKEVLRQAIEGLPERQREIINLLLSDLTTEEAASEMGIAVKTAYNYRSLALKKLREICC